MSMNLEEVKNRKYQTGSNAPLSVKSIASIDGGSVFKDIDPANMTYSGYFASKNVRDGHGETILDGAFNNTFERWGPTAKNRIKVVWMHDPFSLIGKPLELREDDFGAFHVSKISHTQLGRDTFKLIQDGVITEQSFAFDYMQQPKWNEDLASWMIPEVRVWEHSPVTWGANELTPILSFGEKFQKDQGGLIIPSIKNLLAHTEKVQKSLRSGEWETDYVPIALEMFLKMLSPALQEAQSLLDKEPIKKDIAGEDAEASNSDVEQLRATLFDGLTEPCEVVDDEKAEQVFAHLRATMLGEDRI